MTKTSAGQRTHPPLYSCISTAADRGRKDSVQSAMPIQPVCSSAIPSDGSMMLPTDTVFLGGEVRLGQWRYWRPAGIVETRCVCRCGRYASAVRGREMSSSLSQAPWRAAKAQSRLGNLGGETIRSVLPVPHGHAPPPRAPLPTDGGGEYVGILAAWSGAG
ncbi:hypothetical protein MRX96_000711 [Rhipicephalus microplus]